MRTIRVFISASDDLVEVGAAVRDLLVQLNRNLKPRMEFLPTPPGAGPSHGDLVLALYRKDFGPLPAKSFEEAYESFREEKAPKIYVFFRDPDPDITEALKAFKDSFAERYGHFYCHFETVDSVKFQLTVQSLSLLPDAETRDALKVDGEKVRLGDVTVASLENLPFAKLNSRRRTLQRQAAKEEEEVRELEEAANAAPDDEDLKDALREARIRIRRPALQVKRLAGRRRATQEYEPPVHHLHAPRGRALPHHRPHHPVRRLVGEVHRALPVALVGRLVAVGVRRADRRIIRKAVRVAVTRPIALGRLQVERGRRGSGDVPATLRAVRVFVPSACMPSWSMDWSFPHRSIVHVSFRLSHVLCSPSALLFVQSDV